MPFLTFYFLRDWDVLKERVAALVPRDHIEHRHAPGEANPTSVLGAFLRGQFSVMLVLGVLYALGLWAVGLDLGLLIGFIAGIVSFVPYLGPASGVVLGVIAALVQFGDWKHVALVLGVFGIGQVIESYFLTPRLVGDKIGLHPVAVIFAIMAGGQLFGFLGVLLALPVAAVANVLLRYAHERYTHSRLLCGDRPGIELDRLSSTRALERPDAGRQTTPDVRRCARARNCRWPCVIRRTSASTHSSRAPEGALAQVRALAEGTGRRLVVRRRARGRRQDACRCLAACARRGIGGAHARRICR